MTNHEPYRVLARKYRPQTFADLYGHEGLVQTVSNAIAAQKIAHAFLLTGIRGVGKTTTARILARSLNCIGPDGQGTETIAPCGVCEPCVSILQGSHMDVIEMDAASRTSVDDIREIIDSIPYKPTSARYKVYIIDEVHMLSKNAFNALLKTLEEPPAHVKFIMATTELRKVPVTVISRCQRFDLKRLTQDTLCGLLDMICTKESISAPKDALALIAKTAEGSARDAISLLDQARALTGDTLTLSPIQDMLGLADRSILFDLLENLLKGEAAPTLVTFDTLIQKGGDPVLVMQDLLDLVHTLTHHLIRGASSTPLPEAELSRITSLSSLLRADTLGRLWQALLKGLQDIQRAPLPDQAAEMVLIRAAYMADLPTPLELLSLEPKGSEVSGVAPKPPVQAQALPCPKTFEDITKLVYDRKEMILYNHLLKSVKCVGVEGTTLTLHLLKDAPSKIAADLSGKLTTWLGTPWTVLISDQERGETLAETHQARKTTLTEESKDHPLVQSVLHAFPGSEITNVTPLETASDAA